jgi:hypothetical protein
MNWDLIFTILGVGVALSIVFTMLGIVYAVIVAVKLEAIVKVAKKFNTSSDDAFQQLIEFNKEKS